MFFTCHTFSMWLKYYMLFHQYLIFCSFVLPKFVSANALYGDNVRQAEANQFPFVAGIVQRSRHFNPTSHTICTGVLITEKDILTADHCVEDLVTNSIEVLIGSLTLSSGTKYYPAWWITYDQWIVAMSLAKNNYPTNDICIIRVHGSVANVAPGILSYRSYRDLKGKSVVALGWGETNNGTFPNMLLTGNLKVLSTSECAERAHEVSGKRYKVDKNVLCTTANPYILIMGGDSGGPLMYENKVVAIHSGTCPLPTTRIHPLKINLHLNLKFYEEFISNIIAA